MRAQTKPFLPLPIPARGCVAPAWTHWWQATYCRWSSRRADVRTHRACPTPNPPSKNPHQVLASPGHVALYDYDTAAGSWVSDV